MVENFVCDTLTYYTLSEKSKSTILYVIWMKEDVDGDALKQAVEIATRRYPYLMKQLVATEEGYHLIDNDRPIVVKETDAVMHLCGEESNYHLWGLTYLGRYIYFNNVHAIFDGRGRSMLLHTLMYYYCKIRYNEEVEMDGVALADSPIDPAEDYDPFTQPLPAFESTMPMPTPPGSAFKLMAQGLVHSAKTDYLHFVRINEKQLMQLCRTSDGTPNTVISLLLMRAIAKLHPKREKPIVGQVVCDFRKFVGAEKTHRNMVTTIPLKFTEEMESMPIQTQNTILRGQIIYYTQPDVMMNIVSAVKGACEYVNSLPTLQDKFAALEPGGQQMADGTTFCVSYAGTKSFGSCDKHIEALFPVGDIMGAGLDILIEVTTADGWFYVSFIQGWREDVYFNAFLKEIVENNLDFDLIYSSKCKSPRFDFDAVVKAGQKKK